MNHPRTAGVVLPLFSLRTRHDWGIGQLTDLPDYADHIRRAGHRLLQLLPPHELSGGETSPYGALTAFGIDPIYIGLDAVPDLDEATILATIGDDGARELSRVRETVRVDYRAVRALKQRALHAAFERFVAHEWAASSPRALALKEFIEEERSWLDDLALYTVFREAHGGHGWESWPEPERDRDPSALAHARIAYASRILEVAYGQWVALEQWRRAREQMRELGVELMGDLPFVVCRESADVWARANQFHRGLSLGAPPDAFSPDGQDWGLPPYDWRAMDHDDLSWVRARTRHAARLYDRFRLDHVVGYFRQWVKRSGEKGWFDPDGDESQRARGARVLGAIIEAAGQAQVIAEDLGVIPPFVRETLTAAHTPGYRVIPWEKNDHHHFRDPAAFPKSSVATWSTHDTAPITSWWSDFSDHERTELAHMANVSPSATDDERSLGLLQLLFNSGSDLTLVLAPELIGDRTRINLPGTVSDENWTYRLPMPLEALNADARLATRFSAIRSYVEKSGR